MNSVQPRQEGQQRRQYPRGQQRNRQRQTYSKGSEGRSYEPRGQQHQQRNGDSGYGALEKRPLEELSLTELNILARRLGIVGAGLMRKDALAEKIKYVQEHPDIGWHTQSGYDYYVWRDGRYVGVDLFGLYDWLLDSGKVLFGRTLTQKEFNKVMKRALVDLGEAKKVWLRDERRPD